MTELCVSALARKRAELAGEILGIAGLPGSLHQALSRGVKLTTPLEVLQELSR